MSGNTNSHDNSKSKHLAENSQRTMTASTSTSSDLEDPSPTISLFVVSFECSVCLKKIMEVRSKPCQHTSCLDCVPIQCTVECRKTLIDTIDRPELYDKVLGGYELSCSDLAKVVPKKKRHYPEQD
uniref:Uncharacterized protein n=1 Tax=Schizaphis graminum TaxID=13262 RepID=A0A2S2PJU9_SCHGA